MARAVRSAAGASPPPQCSWSGRWRSRPTPLSGRHGGSLPHGRSSRREITRPPSPCSRLRKVGLLDELGRARVERVRAQIAFDPWPAARVAPDTRTRSHPHGLGHFCSQRSRRNSRVSTTLSVEIVTIWVYATAIFEYEAASSRCCWCTVLRAEVAAREHDDHRIVPLQLAQSAPRLHVVSQLVVGENPATGDVSAHGVLLFRSWGWLRPYRRQGRTSDAPSRPWDPWSMPLPCGARAGCAKVPTSAAGAGPPSTSPGT